MIYLMVVFMFFTSMYEKMSDLVSLHIFDIEVHYWRLEESDFKCTACGETPVSCANSICTKGCIDQID